MLNARRVMRWFAAIALDLALIMTLFLTDKGKCFCKFIPQAPMSFTPWQVTKAEFGEDLYSSWWEAQPTPTSKPDPPTHRHYSYHQQVRLHERVLPT